MTSSTRLGELLYSANSDKANDDDQDDLQCAICSDEANEEDDGQLLYAASSGKVSDEDDEQLLSAAIIDGANNGDDKRTAEELDRDRNRLGGGFRNYGNDRANRSSSDGDDTSNSVPTAVLVVLGLKERGSERSEGGGGRPRLVLQPRTAPVNNESQKGAGNGNGNVVKPKGPSPFGEVRPREEVLVEKGQDWKKIDEQLESMKIKEAVEKKESFEKRGFGSGNGRGSPK
ncbi:hypothetical protein HN51_063284 [Arachis hypogaea]